MIASATLLVALVAVFWSTVAGMVTVWYNSETYTHGFVILPISLWLVWLKRRHLAAYTPQPTYGPLIFLALALALWFIGRVIGLQIIEQLAFITVLLVGLAGILGLQTTKFLAFPLLFLFFAVPMGEELVEPMMEFTATFTVGALRLTGIPVYREGLWFSLPTGEWSVVEACSGVRYLIASVTLGMMYAYITYHTLKKRLLFVAMSVIVPIFANGLRAYMIVMIGHLSNMEYATGVDHLLYGWFFFGIVMFILFWIGAYWQEDEEPPHYVAPVSSMSDTMAQKRLVGLLIVTLVGSIGAAWAVHKIETQEVTVARNLVAPQQIGEWQLVELPKPWEPVHRPTSQLIDAFYRRPDGETVRLHVALFPDQRQGREAISAGNRLSAELNQHGVQSPLTVNHVGQEFNVRRARVIVQTGSKSEGTDEYFRVYYWQWFRIAGKHLSERYAGKLAEASARLSNGRLDGAWLAISTEDSKGASAVDEARIRAFAELAIPQIDTELDAVLGLAN